MRESASRKEALDRSNYINYCNVAVSALEDKGPTQRKLKLLMLAGEGSVQSPASQQHLSVCWIPWEIGLGDFRGTRGAPNSFFGPGSLKNTRGQTGDQSSPEENGPCLGPFKK